MANTNIQIPQNEITFKASRSSGPGGQNVNKLNTKISAEIDIANCSFLTDQQKIISMRKLAGRLTKDNKLIAHSQESRSQKANRDSAVERLTELIENSLKRPKARRPTKPTKTAVEKRLKQKKLKSIVKQQRRGNISFQ
ncbi:MAG: alternative ribosome rescue aminoacyl-tRNA hydrolase ArfB [Phycisphaerae bacterium]|jgi:ribosome-associated protein